MNTLAQWIKYYKDKGYDLGVALKFAFMDYYASCTIDPSPKLAWTQIQKQLNISREDFIEKTENLTLPETASGSKQLKALMEYVRKI